MKMLYIYRCKKCKKVILQSESFISLNAVLCRECGEELIKKHYLKGDEIVLEK